MAALVPWRPEGGALIPPQGGITHTLDLATPAGKRLLYRAVVGSDFTLDDLKDQPIEVESVVVHWISAVVEDTGEVRDRPRGVLITPDGTRISTGSETALRGLEAAAKISCQVAPWQPPLRFTVRHEKRKEGPGHWIWLDWEV